MVILVARHALFYCHTAQHCFAADAAGAAPELGAICTAVPCRRSCRSVEVASSAAESWRWAASQPLNVHAEPKVGRVLVPCHSIIKEQVHATGYEKANYDKPSPVERRVMHRNNTEPRTRRDCYYLPRTTRNIP